MGGVSGGELAAAVSEAGGLGLVGGGYGDLDWLRRELDLVATGTSRPWGVGLITWAAPVEALDVALERRPAAVMLSFGDPTGWAGKVKDAGVRLICQVTSLPEARQALDNGADVLVAQGTEAGGHGAVRSTLPLVPAVVDLAGDTPVLAAGGVSDGRGLAAAFMLGAQGALLGTRFEATPEALLHPRVKRRLLDARGEDTTRTQVFDQARGLDWPRGYTGRAVRNDFLDRWTGHERQLREDDAAREAFRQAVVDGDPDTALLWAGEGVGAVTALEPAGELVRRIGEDAARLLAGA